MGDVRAVTTATPEQRRARLARRHLLAAGARADSVPAVADAVVGLHSSDPVTVYLSAAARLSDPSVAAIERALYDERTVVRIHAMRRTLWVFTHENARTAHAASTADLIQVQRRALGKLLVDNDVTDDPDRWLDDAIATITEVLAAGGGATGREIGEAAPSLRAPLAMAPDKTYGGTIAAHTRVLNLMGFMGIVVRGRPLGTWISGQYRWTLADDWLTAGADPDAAAVLVDRYLRAFGPVSLVDVQWWTGWTKRKSIAALERAGAETVQLDTGDGFAAAGDAGPVSEVEPWVAVLPGLDPTIMGWKERSWYLRDDDVPKLFDRNGNAGPTIWADGRVVGGWAQRADGTIAHRLFAPLSGEHQRLLDDEFDRLREFVGATRFTIRFATPVSKELSAP
jgi:hypothetical protein